MIPIRDAQKRRRSPLATWGLAAANAAAFAWELSLGPGAGAALARVAISPAEVVALSEPLALPFRLLSSDGQVIAARDLPMQMAARTRQVVTNYVRRGIVKSRMIGVYGMTKHEPMITTRPIMINL